MSDGPRVLVVHYDAAQAESIAAALTEAGAEVACAINGDQALAEAQDGNFQLAFVSTLLPGTHGFEVCRQISATPPAGESEAPPAAVILLTDVEDPYVRARARHAGAKQVVIEPLSPEALQSLLAVRWQDVDPLELPGATPSGPSGDLLQQLMADSEKTDESDGFLGQLADPLTGLANESYTMMKIDEEAKRASRYKQDLSLVVAQIDNHAELVERMGQGGADEAALDIAGVFLCESRDIDIAGRAGTSRFLLLLPNTPSEGAQVVADRFRESLAHRQLKGDDGVVEIEVSLGVATIAGGTGTATRDLILEQAENDRRMGRARR